MYSNFAHNSTPRDHGSGAEAAGSSHGRPHHHQQQQGASELPALPRITSNVKAEEPPLVSVTSDLPEHGGSPSPRPVESHVPAKRPDHPTPQGAGSTTPGRARLEVVLNVSPYKPLPGETLWTEADLDDNNNNNNNNNKADVVTADDVTSRKRRATATHTLAASSNLKADSPATPTQVTGKRSRGRPKGWRPGMPSTKTGQPTASAFRYLDKDGNRIAPRPTSVLPKSTGQKRRGRPPRAPSPTPRDVWEKLDPPQYVPFICEWKGCKAELQNMETLRRHVRKLHGLGGGGLVCRWGDCGRQEPGQPNLFTAEEFHAHMEERHLVPFVWHVGDGVRNEKLILNELPTKEDEAIPAYLLGSDGEQVTPWVKGQEVEDFLTWRENRNRLKQILLQRDQNAPFEEEDEREGDGTTTPPPV